MALVRLAAIFFAGTKDYFGNIPSEPWCTTSTTCLVLLVPVRDSRTASAISPIQLCVSRALFVDFTTMHARLSEDQYDCFWVLRKMMHWVAG